MAQMLSAGDWTRCPANRKFPATICLPLAKLPMVRGSGLDVKPVAGFARAARRACQRLSHRVLRLVMGKSLANVALPYLRCRPLPGSGRTLQVGRARVMP